MKILYGVQGTGNGHITRARSMAKAFRNTDIKVDYLFSGRPSDQYFNMEPFGDYDSRRGLTFTCEKGRINNFKTLLTNNLLQFVSDVCSIDLSNYDLVLTDFEPLTAWAAKLRNKPCLGIGHQYAFKYKIPVAGQTFLTTLVMKYFAPTEKYLGFHWHHFNSPILPPLIELPSNPITYVNNKILVYLPFENLDDVVSWLSNNSQYDFYIYHSVAACDDINNIHIRPFGRDKFSADLASCSGVIANAGFGLTSEAIQYGKKLLIKPVKGQMEQLSNAVAIKELCIGEVMYEYDARLLDDWLLMDNPRPRHFPCVASAIVEWINGGLVNDEMTLAKSLWEQCPQFSH